MRVRLAPWGFRFVNYFEIVKGFFFYKLTITFKRQKSRIPSILNLFLFVSQSLLKIQNRTTLEVFQFRDFHTKIRHSLPFLLMHWVEAWFFYGTIISQTFIQVDTFSRCWKNGSWQTDSKQHRNPIRVMFFSNE